MGRKVHPNFLFCFEGIMDKDTKTDLVKSVLLHEKMVANETLKFRVSFSTVHSYDDWVKAGAGKYRWYDSSPNDFGALWALRTMNITRCGFPIITAELADELAQFLIGKRVADVGCGTGYLTYHLRQRGVNVIGIDAHIEDNHYFPRIETQFLTMVNRLIVKMNYCDIDTRHFDMFIMSWPDYNGEEAEKFLLDLPVGKILVYQGEDYGGCCATDNFFEILQEDFIELDRPTKSLRQYSLRFYGIRDEWTVYRKVSRNFIPEV